MLEGERAQQAREHATGLMDRATKLYDVLNNVNQDEGWTTREDIAAMHREFRTRLGEKIDPDATGDTIIADFKRANEELKRIEDEMRTIYEKVVPFARTKEVGIRGILEPGSLRVPGALPRGAYVHRITDFTRRGNRFYGIRPGRDIPSGAIRNHFLSVADRLVGHLDVVSLTHEQMNDALLRVKLPPETPAFYDPRTDRIFITHEAMASPARGAILGHEIGHAISESGFEAFPEIKKDLDNQRRALKKAYDKNEGRVRAILDGDTQGLDNVHEFFSHLWSNPAVRRMRSMK